MCSSSRVRGSSSLGLALADKVDVESHDSLDVIVGVEGTPAGGLSWHSFLERGGDVGEALEERLAGLRPEDPATLIYTAAGFGGALGVVLTHDNLAFASGVSVEVFEPTSDDRVLSYLPLSHVAEQMFTIHIAAHAGYSVAFAQSIGRIRVDLPEIQPTIFFSVPLVWSGFERVIPRRSTRSRVGNRESPSGPCGCRARASRLGTQAFGGR